MDTTEEILARERRVHTVATLREAAGGADLLAHLSVSNAAQLFDLLVRVLWMAAGSRMHHERE